MILNNLKDFSAGIIFVLQSTRVDIDNVINSWINYTLLYRYSIPISK